MNNLNVEIYSHVGNSRPQQEDSVLFINEKDVLYACGGKDAKPQAEYSESNIGSKQFLCALSDGMGGHLSGEIASYYTLSLLARETFSLYNLDKEETLSIIADINDKVVQKSIENPELKGMGATLCGIVVSEDNAKFFNVGDSRIYSFAGGQLSQLTNDHTEGKRLLDLKLLTEKELETFAHRKSLYKYIGLKSHLKADYVDIGEIVNSQIFLLCSDGLTDVISDDEIENVLKGNCTLKGKRATLINCALKRNEGRGDNISLVLIEINKRENCK